MWAYMNFCAPAHKVAPPQAIKELLPMSKVIWTYYCYFLKTDLLHIQPAPNNGTHGSLNHLLKAPFYEPSHAGELSTPSTCGFTTPLPTDTLDCVCDVLKPVSNSIMTVKEPLSLYSGLAVSRVTVCCFSDPYLSGGTIRLGMWVCSVNWTESFYCMLTHLRHPK